jgi:hypothetical protein
MTTKYIVKLTCYTPKGQAEKCSKSFAASHFDALKAPVATVVVSPGEFYYMYHYSKKAEVERLLTVKIPKAEANIRKAYSAIIFFIHRANKLAKKHAWGLEKATNWLKRRLRLNNSLRSYAEMKDAITIDDEPEIMEFLTGDLFRTEIKEVEEDVV